MQIKLHPTACLNEIGKRDNNEDSIFPVAGNATAATRLFMVCDGVGGSAKGEEASRLACQSFAAYCANHPTALPDNDYINAALQYIEAAFDASLVANPTQKGMGTTVTLVCLHTGGITAAHIGDSRIYNVRKGEIKWVTSDHSLVNDYLKAGILTPETAINHPQKNVITRALQGASVRKTRADVHIITDIATDDYIFMCTDGILESVSDADLCRILGDNRLAIEDQIAQINNLCTSHSRDNFSCYLIKIEKVEGQITPQYGLISVQNKTENIPESSNENQVEIVGNTAIPPIISQNINISTQNNVIENDVTETAKLKNNQTKYMQIALGIILLGIISFLAMSYFNTKPQIPKIIIPTPHEKPVPENHNHSVESTPVKTNTNAVTNVATSTATSKPVPHKTTPPTTNLPATTQTTNVVEGNPVPVPAPTKLKPQKPKLDPKTINEQVRYQTKVGPESEQPKNEKVN